MKRYYQLRQYKICLLYTSSPASAAAAGGGAVIFGMVIVETQPAVDLNPLGQRQRIEGINPEGIGPVSYTHLD